MKKEMILGALIILGLFSILIIANRSSNYCKEYAKIYDSCSSEVELPTKYKEDSCIKLISKKLNDKYTYDIDNLNYVCKKKLEEKKKEEDLKLPAANVTATFKFFPATRAELITNPTLLRYCDHTSSTLCPNDLIEINFFNKGDFDIENAFLRMDINKDFKNENTYQDSKFSIGAHSSKTVGWTPKVGCGGVSISRGSSISFEGDYCQTNPLEGEKIILKMQLGYWERGEKSTHKVLELEEEISLRNITRWPSISTVREKMFADITFITPYNEMVQRAAKGFTYDTSTQEYIRRAVENLWNFLDRNMEISYLPQPKPKYMRFPEQVIMEKGGDCDELVYTFVSILEYIGIKTEVINYRDTAYTEVGHSIFRFYDGQKWNAVEATLIGKSDFEQALKKGEENYVKSTKDPRRSQFQPRELWDKGFIDYNPRIDSSFAFWYYPGGAVLRSNE